VASARGGGKRQQALRRPPPSTGDHRARTPRARRCRRARVVPSTGDCRATPRARPPSAQSGWSAPGITRGVGGAVVADASAANRRALDARGVGGMGAIHEADLNLDGRSRLAPSVGTPIATRRATPTRMPRMRPSAHRDSSPEPPRCPRQVHRRAGLQTSLCAPPRTTTSRSPRRRVSDEPTQRRPRLASCVRASSGRVARHVRTWGHGRGVAGPTTGRPCCRAVGPTNARRGEERLIVAAVGRGACKK
jgi:hypothetical protein